LDLLFDKILNPQLDMGAEIWVKTESGGLMLQRVWQ
jgi:hypothetical protein